MYKIGCKNNAIIVFMDFNIWLQREMGKRRWDPKDFQEETGLKRQTIYNYLHRGRIPNAEAIEKIAKAFKIAKEEVYRAANLLPPLSEADELDEKIRHIVSNYRRSNTKKRALRQLELLLIEEQEEEKEAGRGRPNAVSTKHAPSSEP